MRPRQRPGLRNLYESVNDTCSAIEHDPELPPEVRREAKHIRLDARKWINFRPAYDTYDVMCDLLEIVRDINRDVQEQKGVTV